MKPKTEDRTVRRILFVALAAMLLMPAVTAAEEMPAGEPDIRAFGVSDEALPANLYFMRSPGLDPVPEGVTVYGVRDGVYLVSGDVRVLRALSMRGYEVTPVHGLPEAPQSEPREWTRIEEPDPAISALVDQVDWDGVGDKIGHLVNFKTRSCIAPNHENVASSITRVFESYGLPTEMQPFDYFSLTMWNIVAVQRGTKYPDSYIVICGHFDSTSRSQMILAPGADDNGTGVAAVMTAAEILSRHDFEYSILYICFDAEELGLIGSRIYANLARRFGMDIVGVLNFDMIGYWTPGVEKDLEIETDHASQWLAAAVINAAELYTGTPFELHVYDDAWWGDHYYFWRAGFAAVNHEEAWDWYDPDFNPYYHSAQDVIEHLSPDFTVSNVKVGVAALATLAGYVHPLRVAFDVRPGSPVDPFNPKSNGAVPALVTGSGEVDVRDIDTTSLRVGGVVAPLRFHFMDMSNDGVAELMMKLPGGELAALAGGAGKGVRMPLQLTGRLLDGTAIMGEDTITIVCEGHRSVESVGARTPATAALHQNRPNPFNPATVIAFDLPRSEHVRLDIYDVRGELVANLIDTHMTAGRKEVSWEAKDARGNTVSSGVYFYRLVAGDWVQTKKMVLLR